MASARIHRVLKRKSNLLFFRKFEIGDKLDHSGGFNEVLEDHVDLLISLPKIFLYSWPLLMCLL